MRLPTCPPLRPTKTLSEHGFPRVLVNDISVQITFLFGPAWDNWLLSYRMLFTFIEITSNMLCMYASLWRSAEGSCCWVRKAVELKTSRDRKPTRWIVLRLFSSRTRRTCCSLLRQGARNLHAVVYTLCHRDWPGPLVLVGCGFGARIWLVVMKSFSDTQWRDNFRMTCTSSEKLCELEVFWAPRK